jgi:DNA-binding transcriptional LysR family regulator
MMPRAGHPPLPRSGCHHRSSRKVALTEAGSVLLAEGRRALVALSAAELRTQQAAKDKPSLVLVTKAGTSGDLLAKLLDAYAAEPGAVAVDFGGELPRGPGTAGSAQLNVLR